MNRKRSGQFFIGVGLILLSLMGVLFVATTRAFRPAVTGSAAHSALVEGATVRAVRSAFANASNTADVGSAFNNALLRTYLGRIVGSEQGVFEDFSIVEKASKGNGTVSARVLVNIRTAHANWNLDVPLNLKQDILSITVARGTSPQFETVTLTIKLTLNGAPDQIASASLLISGQQGAAVACNIVARYSDGNVVLQAQVPSGWTDAQLVTLDINGIKVSTSLKHPP